MQALVPRRLQTEGRGGEAGMAQPKDHDDHEDDCTQTQALQQSKYIGLNPHGVYLKKAYAKSEMSGSGP